MHETPFPIYPMNFEPVVTDSDMIGLRTLYIGNSGGKYEWREHADYFEQHFNPDGSGEAATSPELIQKHATLYPAALYEFIQWQNALDLDDPVKSINTISGKTNKEMSDFRQRLLGSYYHVAHNETTDMYEYRIDLQSLKNDLELMKRLKLFSSRAQRQNYTTTMTPPKPGIIDSLVITVDDLENTETT